MAIIEKIMLKAKKDVRRIVLPEGEEKRNIAAASKIVKEGLARITLLGDPAKITETAKTLGVDIEGAQIINPASSEKAKPYAEALYMLRKAKGMTPEEAAQKLT
jgi:phosphate acetyltransferase